MYDNATNELKEHVMAFQELPRITMMKATEKQKAKHALRRMDMMKD